MDSALNNLKRVDMPLNKETKPSFLFRAIQFSQAILIQFSKSTDFVYTQLHVRTVLC